MTTRVDERDTASREDERGTTLRIEERTALATFRRGLALSPEFRAGLAGTLLLAVVATVGKVIVPIAVQQVIDEGLRDGTPDMPFIRNAVVLCAVAVVLTALCGYLMNVRLYRSTESALASLRVQGFRHVHDLSVLTQSTERRGALVSRVTGDVDQISQFMQWGGLMVIIVGRAASGRQRADGRLLLAAGAGRLGLLPAAGRGRCRGFQRWLVQAPTREVRERTGDMLAAIGESVVGAAVIRALRFRGAHRRADRRRDRRAPEAPDQGPADHRVTFPLDRAGRRGLAIAGVVVVGVELGVAGTISAGRLVAFLFLITLFVSPMQIATEVLNEAQNAVAGWRGSSACSTPPPTSPTPASPGRRACPRGSIAVSFQDVGFAYPGRAAGAARGVAWTSPPRTRVAVVGETGSGKTTFAKLLTRLMDPTSGRVLVDGVDLRKVRFSSLRRRIVMVPQDGFLFDGTLAEQHPRSAGPRRPTTEIAAGHRPSSAWPTGWRGCPPGSAPRSGSAASRCRRGERQLVALARAYLADPDLLVLDEATRAVDPATEVRLASARSTGSPGAVPPSRSRTGCPPRRRRTR